MKCQGKNCKNEITGRQRKYCCLKCKNSILNYKHQRYEVQFRRGFLRKKELVDRKGGKCIRCGYEKNYSALTFHHRDPSKKELKLDIRHMSNGNFKKLSEEADKCDLLCFNCHMEIENPILEKQ